MSGSQKISATCLFSHKKNNLTPETTKHNIKNGPWYRQSCLFWRLWRCVTDVQPFHFYHTYGPSPEFLTLKCCSQVYIFCPVTLGHVRKRTWDYHFWRNLLLFVAPERFMDEFYFVVFFFSLRGNLFECSSMRAITGSTWHLYVCGFGMVAWLRTITPILRRQLLKQNTFIYIKFDFLLLHVLLKRSAQNLRYSLANDSQTESALDKYSLNFSKYWSIYLADRTFEWWHGSE